VLFRGKPGRVLWQRVGQRAKELSRWLDEDGAPRKEHARDFVNFLMDAAWGEEVAGTGQGGRFGTRAERVKHRWMHNEDSYRLSVGKHRLDVAVRCEKVEEHFSLGRVRGFTAVLPLRPEGVERYLT